MLAWILFAATGASAQNWNIQVVGQLGGGCLGIQSDGQYAYIGEGPNLTVLDVSGTSNPLPVKRLRFSGTVGDTFLQATLGRVYTANWISGVSIVNVSNPLSPHVMGTYRMNATSLFVSGGRAFAARVQGGVNILNVGAGTTPTLAGKIDGTGYVHNIWVSNKLAYLALLGGGLAVYDVTTVSAPVRRVVYRGAPNAWDVTTSGSLAFIAASDLYVVNFRTVTTPTLVAVHGLPGYGMSICLRNNRVYVGTTSGTVQIIDVRNPAAPRTLGSWKGAVAPASVYVVGTKCYVADNARGVYVLDVSNPALPRRVGFYGTPVGVHAVRVPSSSKAYLAAYDFYTIDINDPSNPNVFNIYETPYELAGVDIAGNNASLTHQTARELLLVNIGDPSSPVLVGHYPPYANFGPTPPVPKAPFTYPRDIGPKVDVRGNLTIVSGLTSGALELLNTGQPSNITRRSLYSLPYFVGDLILDANTAYVANGATGLKILDVGDASHARLVGSYPAWALSFHRSDYSGQIGDGGRGIWLVDCTNLTSPRLFSRYLCPGPTYGLEESGGILFTASADQGLHAIDISEPTSPTLVGRFHSDGMAVDVNCQGSLIYLADRYTGLWILRYTGPPARGRRTAAREWWQYR